VLRDRRVVVVGGGNSGVDIAVAASYVAERAMVSLRRGVHVIRKHLSGKPVDQQLAPPWLPWALKQKGFEVLRRRSGSISDYGFPEPDHKIGHAHPTVSDDFVDRLADGTIVPKPNIRELRGDRVEFEDGTVEEADVIVYCTGYRVSFPFFDPGFVSAPDNDLPLYRRLFHPDVSGLYFIGLAQPLGALMPMAEESSKWVAQLLTGRYRLPGPAEVRADMEAERAAHAKRFYRSKRHTMEVDFDEWLARARSERERGAERAAASGYRPEVVSRARDRVPAVT
jgi:cation diffusion facilitator CzcD-associated flavoprotein CzcO